MTKLVKKSFDAPEETRSLHKGKIEVVDLGGVKVRRVIHDPGWRWSECVKPVVGTDSCQVGHLIHVISGRIVARMDDGSEAEFGPGDVGSIPPGHDALVRCADDSRRHNINQRVLRGCLKSPDSVIFHRLCFPFQLPNSWGEPRSAYRES